MPEAISSSKPMDQRVLKLHMTSLLLLHLLHPDAKLGKRAKQQNFKRSASDLAIIVSNLAYLATCGAIRLSPDLIQQLGQRVQRTVILPFLGWTFLGFLVLGEVKKVTLSNVLCILQMLTTTWRQEAQESVGGVKYLNKEAL